MPKKIIDLDGLKKFRQEADKKYVIEGEYSPSTRVGVADEADNLTPYGDNSGAHDDSAFVFQTTGGSADTSDVAYLKSIKGKTVVWNQLAQNGDFSNGTTGWASENITRSVANNKLTGTCNGDNKPYMDIYRHIPFVKDHKYLLRATIKTSVATTDVRFALLDTDYVERGYVEKLINVSTKTTHSVIITCTKTDNNGYAFFKVYGTFNTGDTVEYENVQVFDLGADTEYDTVLKFNRDFPKPYYADNAGELISSKLKKIKNVGYNAFDGVLESGYIDTSGGNQSNANRVRSKNYIKVIAGQQYTLEEFSSFAFQDNYSILFVEYDENKNLISIGNGTYITNRSSKKTLSNNTHYIRFYIIYSTDVHSSISSIKCAFHLTWDESRTGFEENEEWEYDMPNVELKDVSDTEYDELFPNGTLKTKIATITFNGTDSGKKVDETSGTNGIFQTVGNYTQFYLQPTQITGASEYQNSDYPEHAKSNIGVIKINKEEIGLILHNYNNVKWLLLSLPTATASTAAEANTWLANNNVVLQYPLETAVETQSDDYKYLERQNVDDFGTQEQISDQEVQIPARLEFFYPVDYKAFIDSLGGREDIEYDASELVSHAELNAFLTTISGYDANKTQTLKNVNGTFTWVDDE